MCSLSCYVSFSPEFKGGTWTLKQEKPLLAIIVAGRGFLFSIIKGD